MTTYDTSGEPETGEVRLQLKATDSLPLLRDGRKISWKIMRSDLARWLYDPAPVILVVQALPHFNLFSLGQSTTAHIPKASILDQAAIRQLATYRDAILRQQGGINHGLA